MTFTTTLKEARKNGFIIKACKDIDKYSTIEKYYIIKMPENDKSILIQNNCIYPCAKSTYNRKFRQIEKSL